MTDSDIPKCPLSDSSRVTRVATIRSSDLAALFRRDFGIEIGYLTKAFSHTHLYHSEETDLFFFHPQIIGDARLYQSLQRFPWYYATDKPEYLHACSLVSPDDAVLDIGSGCGSFARLLRCRSYCGLELNPQAAADAHKNGVHVICEAVDQHAATHDSEYDFVCAFQVLEHVPDIRGFLTSATACVKPGGRLVIAVPAYDSFSQYVPNFTLDLPPHHQSRWTDRALQSIASQLDLDLLEMWHEPLQDVHRLFYCHTVCQSALCSHLSYPPRYPIDSRWGLRVISLVSSALARLVSPGLPREYCTPRGLSVTAVYRRPGMAQRASGRGVQRSL